MLPSSVVGAHIQERAYNTHFLYPRSQVWRALIEASVLDEVLLALVAHGTTVIPVEVVQVGIVFMGLCTSIGCATCIVFPRSTLKKKRKISLFELCIFIRPPTVSYYLICLWGRICFHHLVIKVSLWTRLCFVVFGIHTHIEFVQTQSTTGKGQQQDHNSLHSSAAERH